MRAPPCVYNNLIYAWCLHTPSGTQSSRARPITRWKHESHLPQGTEDPHDISAPIFTVRASRNCEPIQTLLEAHRWNSGHWPDLKMHRGVWAWCRHTGRSFCWDSSRSPPGTTAEHSFRGQQVFIGALLYDYYFFRRQTFRC